MVQYYTEVPEHVHVHVYMFSVASFPHVQSIHMTTWPLTTTSLGYGYNIVIAVLHGRCNYCIVITVLYEYVHVHVRDTLTQTCCLAISIILCTCSL